MDSNRFNSQDLLHAPGVKICFFAFFVRVNHYYTSKGDTISQALAIVKKKTRIVSGAIIKD